MTDAAAQAPTPTSSTAPAEDMVWESRGRRMVTIYLPLICFVIILLFPFYWMGITAFKPNAELYDYKTYNPFLIGSPTLDHIYKLLFQTAYPKWLMTTMGVAICSTFLSLLSSVLRPMPSSGCASGAASMSASASISPIWCRRRSCSFRWRQPSTSSACSTRRWR